MDKKTVRDIDVRGKIVLIRVDFNVPVNEKGKIINDKQIQFHFPTIEYLVEQGAKVVLITHWGKTGFQMDESLRLDTLRDHLEKILKKKVYKANDVFGNCCSLAIFPKSYRSYWWNNIWCNCKNCWSYWMVTRHLIESSYLPLPLRASADAWRLYSARKADQNFLSFQNRVWQRDDYKCRFCGFQAQIHQEVVNIDGNFRNNKLENLATACVFCSQCFFLESIGVGG